MPKATLRTAVIICLLIWAAIWFVFLAIRFSTFDIRGVPGIGFVMLGAISIALIAPIVATALAGAAVVRQPRTLRDLLTLAFAIAALIGQALLFLLTKLL
jgi:hypothetical protein